MKTKRLGVKLKLQCNKKEGQQQKKYEEMKRNNKINVLMQECYF